MRRSRSAYVIAVGRLGRRCRFMGYISGSGRACSVVVRGVRRVDVAATVVHFACSLSALGYSGAHPAPGHVRRFLCRRPGRRSAHGSSRDRICGMRQLRRRELACQRTLAGRADPSDGYRVDAGCLVTVGSKPKALVHGTECMTRRGGKRINERPRNYESRRHGTAHRNRGKR